MRMFVGLAESGASALGGALACFGVVLVFLLMFPITFALERRRLRKTEMLFLTRRHEMTNEEFLARMAAEPDRVPFYRVGRQAMAKLCGIPETMVHPDDTVRSLLNLQFDGGYIQDFVFDLEREANVFIHKDRFCKEYCDKMSFGSFLKDLANGASLIANSRE